MYGVWIYARLFCGDVGLICGGMGSLAPDRGVNMLALLWIWKKWLFWCDIELFWCDLGLFWCDTGRFLCDIRLFCGSLRHTATRTLQHAHYNTHCNIHSGVGCRIEAHPSRMLVVTHCNTHPAMHTATYTLHHTKTHCNIHPGSPDLAESFAQTLRSLTPQTIVFVGSPSLDVVIKHALLKRAFPIPKRALCVT